LAHLVKQGCIDHIVSFNFDESLDEALVNELGPALKTIVSERDNRLAEPLVPNACYLIKPHGTISSSRSLRFTRNDVATFPEDIVDFLKNTILPPAGTMAATGEVVGATILVAGFSMRDEAWNQILRSVEINRLYRIDTMTPSDKNRAIAGPLPAPVQEFPLVYASGALILEDVWESIEKLARDGGEAMPSLVRHQFLTSLFANASSSGTPIPATARARADLLLSAARCKGKVSMNTLAVNPRISRYARGADDLLELTDENILHGEGEESGLGGRTFHFRSPDVVLDALRDISAMYGTPGSRSESQLSGWLHELIAGDEVSVSRSEDRVNRFQFRSAYPIFTALELRAKTTEILINPNVRRVLSVSETGFWLTQPWVRRIVEFRKQQGFPALKCEIITIRPDEIPRHSPLFKNTQKFAIPLATSDTAPLGHLAIHWWEHNRHMTLGLDGDDASSSAVAGIYFARRQNNPLIHPVYVDDPVDTATLQHVFWRYRHKHFRRRVYAASLGEYQSAFAGNILWEAIQDSTGALHSHFGRARSLLGQWLRTDSDSAVLGAYVRGIEMDVDTLVGILGFTNLGFSRDPALVRKVKIEVVAVKPNWRRCGIGRLLMEALEDRVTQHGGHTDIETEGTESPLPDRDAFLAKMGYYEDAEMRGMFSKRLAPYFAPSRAR